LHALVRHVSDATSLHDSETDKDLVRNLCSPTFKVTGAASATANSTSAAASATTITDTDDVLLENFESMNLTLNYPKVTGSRAQRRDIILKYWRANKSLDYINELIRMDQVVCISFKF